MKKIYKPLTAALVAAAVLSMTACTNGTTNLPESNTPTTNNNNDIDTIQVTGTGRVNVVPDMAQINFSVYSDAEDPKTCQEINSIDTGKVVELLKNSGIEEKSIQTSSYGLEPMYDWKEYGRQIVGYQMNTSITLSGIPVDQVGTIISSSVDAGINALEGVTYLSSKYDESYGESLQKAVDSAKSKAQVIAAASGATLDGIAQITELDTYPNIRYASSYEGDIATETQSLIVEPGQLGVEARISVTFRIK